MNRLLRGILFSVLPFSLQCVAHSEDTTVLSLPEIGERVNSRMEAGVAVTEGVIRVRRRHENDMDFSKYNPFYWEGRQTRFRVDDYTPTGEQKITFTLQTEWPQDATPQRGPDFSMVYIGDPLAHESQRSKFAHNVRMKHVKDFRHFEYTVENGAFRAFAERLQPGKLLTFEFRFFNREAHPPWRLQKQRNPQNLSAYYSEFLRIRIGSPGLSIDNLQEPNTFPSPKRYSGGWTTIPTVRVEPWKALQQQSFNLTPEKAGPFLRGRTWFHTDFKTGRHLSDRSDDKPSVFFAAMEDERRDYTGSLYNVTSCTQCHIRNGTALLPDQTPSPQPLHNFVVKTMDRKTGQPHPLLGRQLQTAGEHKEGHLKITRVERKQVTLNDGTVLTLSRPVFHIVGLEGDTQPALSPRRPPALIGLGLLEAVPDPSLITLAESSKGKANLMNGRVGRFGWKADQTTVAAQIQEALLNDMGIVSDADALLDSPGNVTPGKAPLPAESFKELETYVALLGVPPRNHPDDPKVIAGERIFHSLNCQSCHRPTLQTGKSHHRELQNQTIHPYTDLLLHDMGDGLADDSPHPNARMWRTAPLWGLKNVRDANDDLRSQFRAADTNVTFQQTHAAARKNRMQFLHDGRANSLAEAILWHGGEAADSVRKYKTLSRKDREALEAFLWDL